MLSSFECHVLSFITGERRKHFWLFMLRTHLSLSKPLPCSYSSHWILLFMHCCTDIFTLSNLWTSFFHHIFLVTLSLAFHFICRFNNNAHEFILPSSCNLYCWKGVSSQVTTFSTFSIYIKLHNTLYHSTHILFLKIRLWRLKNDNPSYAW